MYTTREAAILSVDKILNILNQDNFKIYARRDVDSIVASIKLVEKFGKNVIVKLVDEPVEDEESICIGFKCGLVAIDSDGFKIFSQVLKTDSTSISFKIFTILNILNRIDRSDIRDLEVGIVWWETQFCDYPCQAHWEFHRVSGSRSMIALPFIEKGLDYALRTTTIPILPGLTGVGVGKKLDDFWDAVILASERAYSVGFYPSLIDKMIKLVGDPNSVTNAEIWEAVSMRFVDSVEGSVDRYVDWIVGIFSSTIQSIERIGGFAIARLPRFELLLKLGPYFRYYYKDRVVAVYERRGATYVLVDKSLLKEESSSVSLLGNYALLSLENLGLSDVVRP